MDKNDLVGLICGVGFLTAIFTGIPVLLSKIDSERQKEQENAKITLDLCYQTRKIFDENESGMLEPEECVKLARAVGYEEVFPTNQPVAQLYPGKGIDEIILKMSSSGSDMKVRGFFTGGSGQPVWNEEYKFPKSRLEELIRKTQSR